MNQQSGRGFLALAALAGIVIIALGYAFAVRPQLSAASVASEDRDVAVQDNDLLQQQINGLKKLSLEVDGWQLDIDTVREQIPRLPDTAGLQKMFTDAALTAGVPWIDFRVEDISKLSAPKKASNKGSTADSTPAAGAEDAGAEDAGAKDAGAKDAAAKPEVTTKADPAQATVDGLVAVQFSLATEGSPDSLIKFITTMYGQKVRYVTVSSFAFAGSGGADASPGRPRLAIGDATLTLSGIAYVLIDPTDPIEVDEADGLPPLLFDPAGTPFDPNVIVVEPSPGPGDPTPAPSPGVVDPGKRPFNPVT